MQWVARVGRPLRRIVGSHGWVVACLAALVVRQARFADRVNLVDFDSRFDAALARRALSWQSWIPGLRNEFLTGLGNLQWGNVRWLDPVSIAGVLGGGIYDMTGAAVVGVLVTFGGTRWLARCFDLRSGPASLAGVVAACVAVGPGLLPVVLPDQFRIVPSFPVVAAVAAMVVGSFERVGATVGRRRVGHGALVAAGSTYLVLVHPHYAVLPAFVCVVAGTSLVVHRVIVRAPVRAQILLIAGLVVAWWAGGVLAFLRGFYAYVAAVEFGDRFSWTFASLGSPTSLAIRTWFPQASSETLRIGAVLAVGSGLIVGWSSVRSRRGRMASTVTALLAAILAYRVSQRWWPHELGPTSDYLAWMSIPFLAVAAASGADAVVERGLPFVGGRRRITGGVALLASLAVIVLETPRIEPAPAAFPSRPAGGWSEVVDAISLDVDSLFRGRAVVVARASEAGAVTLGRAAPFDQTLRWGVPVLNEHSHLQTPASFDFFGRFLFREGDGQIRNHPGLRRIDERILRLLGVRFLIADAASPVGDFVRRSDADVVPTPYGDLVLFESRGYNDGSYSPTEVRVTRDRGGTLSLLADPDLDPSRVAVTEDSSLAHVPLVAASGVRLTYVAGDLRVRATSRGESLLVLPLEFSRCIRLRPADGAVPSLHRVDGILTGVRFTGRIDARIEFRYGPRPWSRCRLDDLADYRDASS